MMATYFEALEIIDSSSNSDDMIIAYTIKDVLYDHMPYIFSHDEARVILGVINRIGANLGKPVKFAVYPVGNW